MEVPVIIVTFNSASTIKACIDSVYAGTRQVMAKITVIDNASEDQTVSLIRTEFPEIAIITNPKNKGFSSAANQGLKMIDAPFVVLLNPDIVFQNNAIELCIQALQQTPASWCCGAIVNNEDFIPRFPGIGKILFEQFFLHQLFPAAYRRFFFLSTEQIKQQKKLVEVDYVNGALMCIRSEALKKKEAFDESFFLYGEETELCVRMKKQGWLCHINPAALILHHTGSSIKQLPRDKIMRIHRRSLLLLTKKTKSFLYTLVIRIALSLGDLIRLPLKKPSQTLWLLGLNWSV